MRIAARLQAQRSHGNDYNAVGRSYALSLSPRISGKIIRIRNLNILFVLVTPEPSWEPAFIRDGGGNYGVMLPKAGIIRLGCAERAGRAVTILQKDNGPIEAS